MSKMMICPCGAVAERASDNAGENRRATGWLPVSTHKGTIRWLCPECGEEVTRHAQAINDLTGEKDVLMSSLIEEQ